jgi:hypothetical protein
VFYALHAHAIGIPSGRLIASGDAAFTALLVSSRFTHPPEAVAQTAGCNAGQLKYYNRSEGFTRMAGRGKVALPNAAGGALPPFSRIGVRRG